MGQLRKASNRCGVIFINYDRMLPRLDSTAWRQVKVLRDHFSSTFRLAIPGGVPRENHHRSVREEVKEPQLGDTLLHVNDRMVVAGTLVLPIGGADRAIVGLDTSAGYHSKDLPAEPSILRPPAELDVELVLAGNSAAVV